ncbi:hypothetical protein DBT_0331 [Dissulfuribacter thermophilus]|uniref:Uncharacterized protein n=1 Tax=Dissulfuribacter thermophilus TaxID=1156395 RepID=A0A1B9F9H0_9BACT|nr:hypothetical protein [Dissulfuribacter thermophilus]OCC16514.1 hypothetical protein DBT_0331 [Dissulfuribacter thermophilus]
MARDALKTVDDLKEGMTLSKDLFSQTGTLLLKGGEALTEDTIAWLKRLDIKAVWVKEGGREGLTEEEVERIKEELDYRFRRVKGDPLMDDIRSCIFQFLTGREA